MSNLKPTTAAERAEMVVKSLRNPLADWWGPDIRRLCADVEELREALMQVGCRNPQAGAALDSCPKLAGKFKVWEPIESWCEVCRALREEGDSEKSPDPETGPTAARSSTLPSKPAADTSPAPRWLGSGEWDAWLATAGVEALQAEVTRLRALIEAVQTGASIWHLCPTTPPRVRPYPALLCSMCRTPGGDFEALVAYNALVERVKELERETEAQDLYLEVCHAEGPNETVTRWCEERIKVAVAHEREAVAALAYAAGAEAVARAIRDRATRTP